MSSMPSITFETQFAVIYQRNNKAKSKSSSGGDGIQVNKVGMKNMRCFPCHSPQGHVEHGFCGSTVAFSTTQPNTHKLRAWAQFELVESAPRYLVGERTRLAIISQDLERSRSARTKPFLPAHLVDAVSGRFIINQERLGYNYSWVSNVHSCHFKHCLAVYLFRLVDDEGEELECLDVARSSEFGIVCSRSSGRQGSPKPSMAATLSPAISESASPISPPPKKVRRNVDENLQRTAESLLMLSSTHSVI